MNRSDWFLIILLGIIWGFSFPFNAILLRELEPLWISAGRLAIGALGSWAILFFAKKKLPTDISLIFKIFALGIVSYAIPFTLFPIAQQYLSSGVASILSALTPITTVIISHFWIGGENATWRKVIGVGAGFSGATILAFPALQSGETSQLWAIGLVILATLCYAGSMNYLRHLPKIDPAVMATLALSGASVVALIFAFAFDGIPTITKTETWVSLFGIGLVATAFAFQIMYRLLPRVGATNFSVTTFIAPVSAIIVGVTILGEHFQIYDFVGMVIIFIGLLLIDGRIVAKVKTIKN